MNSRLNIQDLAGLLSEYTGKERAEVEQFLKCLISVISEGVYSDKLVKIKGLGTFKIIIVEKRESINVNTGERFLIPAHYKFSFLPDKDLREQVNKPFSAFETTEIQANVNFTDMDESVEDEEKVKEIEDESVEEVMPEQEEVVEKSKPKLETAMGQEPVVREAVESVSEEVKPIPEERTLVVEEPTSFQEDLRPKSVEVSVDKQVQIAQEPEKIVPPNEEAVSEPINMQEKEEIPPKKSNKKGVFFAVMSLFVILLAIACFTLGRFYCIPDPIVVQLDQKTTHPQLEELVDTSVVEVSESIEDSTLTHSDKPDRDSVLAKKPLTDPMPPKSLGKVKIKSGDRLTVISLKYYGNKLFWVYIYKHNKSVIADPNNVPIGTIVNIPAPEMYGINAKSSASRAKAAALQTEILTEN